MAKKLQNIALKSVCTDIVSLLSSLSISKEDDESPPPAKKIKLDPGLVVSDLKKKLDEYLIGTHRHFREELWKEYQSRGKQNPDIIMCDFLSCVLDGKFNHLYVSSSLFPTEETASRQGKFYPVELIEIITHNCPSLASLSFEYEKEQSPTNKASQELFAKSFLGLTNLTRLKISWHFKSDLTPFFTYLGHSCPQLRSLQLGKDGNSLAFSLQHLLALVLGEEADILPHSVRQDTTDRMAAMHIQFSQDNVTPICQSLRVLRIFYGDSPLEMQLSSTVFLLRHSPQLAILDLKFEQSSSNPVPCVSIAILCMHSMLYSLNNFNNNVLEENEVTRQIGEQGELRSLKWISIAPPPTTLNLQKLGYDSGTIDLGCRGMLEAVASMCPNLKVVRFVEQNHSASVSPDELISLLTNQLKMVRIVTFDHWCSPESRRAVLASLGDQLLSVKYHHCKSIDLAELVPCIGLRVLEIESGDVKPTSSTTLIDADTFLPQLRKFSVDLCLGQETRLFENYRPTLVDLAIRCVHLGISGASESSWDDVPQLWPQLRSLDLWSPSKTLTFDKLRQIIPQMPYLRSLTLPYRTLPPEDEEDDKEYNDLLNQLKQRSIPIELSFEEDGEGCCHSEVMENEGDSVVWREDDEDSQDNDDN